MPRLGYLCEAILAAPLLLHARREYPQTKREPVLAAPSIMRVVYALWLGFILYC